MSGSVGERSRESGVIPVAVAVMVAVSLSLAIGPVSAAGGFSTADRVGEASQAGAGGVDVSQVNATDSTDGSSRTTIDPALENASGNQSVVVRFDELEGDSSRTGDVRSARQTSADSAQEPLETYANTADGVDFERGFWIANAAVVTVDTDRVAMTDVVRDVSRIDGVREIRTENDVLVRTTADSQVRGQAEEPYLASATEKSSPYNLEQTNVSGVWDGFQTRGEDTTIAVLDSGVDESHPDIDLGAWKDFTANPSDEPTVYDEHGTLVSGIAAGGDESGTTIGVAPNATLVHGAIVSDCDDGSCATSESAVLSGLEWAVEEEADAVSISLGWYRYSDSFISAVESANDAGTVVVGASGNRGEGYSLTPGNVYDTLSVGAADESGDIASFSSGEEIDTSDTWEWNAPDHWPDTYRVPDVAAPGVGVESTMPDGEYRTASGTSIATPHVAGAVALVQSATTADLEADEIVDALRETARKPDDGSALEGEKSDARDGESGDQYDESDTRYGTGIIDVYAAIDAVGTHATVDGKVTDKETNEPIPDATIVLVAGDGTEFETTTGTVGTFELTGLSGDQKYTASVEADGYDGVTETSDAPADETTTIDSALVGDGEVVASVTDDHFDAAIETATVELAGDRGTYTATHSENGTYTAENVPSLSEYDLAVSAEGYVDETAIVSLETADARVAESRSLEGDATLEVAVETDGGEPVEDATVSVVRETGALFEPASRTGENGTLEVTVPGTGERYSIEASEPGAGSGSTESTPIGSQTSDSVTVTLSDNWVATPGFGTVTALIAMLVVSGATVFRHRRTT